MFRELICKIFGHKWLIFGHSYKIYDGNNSYIKYQAYCERCYKKDWNNLDEHKRTGNVTFSKRFK